MEKNTQHSDWMNIVSWVLLVIGILDGGWLFPAIGVLFGYLSMKKGGAGKIPMIVNLVVALLIAIIYSVVYNFFYVW